MTRTYVECSITADQQLAEKLVGLLSQLGFEGFWEDGELLRCYMSNDRWKPAIRAELESVLAFTTRSSSSGAPKLSVTSIEEENWNAEWEKTITPIRVSPRFVITPTWHHYDPLEGEIVLTIDPKMSFGTGYHETTRLVLRLMEKHVRPDMRLLDIGTGTGVLAIAGVRLGASCAVGIDVDEWSYNNAQENIKLNGVENIVRILHGDLHVVPESDFHIIVANIQQDVIVPLLRGMKARLVPEGIVILAGLLTQDRESLLASLADVRFDVLEELRENEWIAFVAASMSAARAPLRMVEDIRKPS